jgi:membrane protein implicated in regulation of membrane protease activity
MAMPIFYLTDTNSLAISPSWWIYLLLASSLTTLTVAFWRWSLRRKRKARDTRTVQEKRMEALV